jgi:hypothetical protein
MSQLMGLPWQVWAHGGNSSPSPDDMPVAPGLARRNFMSPPATVRRLEAEATPTASANVKAVFMVEVEVAGLFAFLSSFFARFCCLQILSSTFAYTYD